MKITRFEISKLFGLYDYAFDLNPDVNIITGFNGYGKSTLLRIIHAVYRSYSVFYKIPFEQMVLTYDDGARIVCKRKHDDDESQFVGEDVLVNRNYEYDIFLEKNGLPDDRSKMYELLINSLDDLYVDDGRRFGTETDVVACNNGISTIVQKVIERYSNMRILTPTKQMEYVRAEVSKEMFEQERALYLKNMETLQSVQILPKGEVKEGEFGDEVSNKLQYAMWKVENMAYDEVREDVDKLVLFAKLIQNSEFADKTFEFRKGLGILFKSTNEDRSIIEVDKLSSGEQHRVILFYNLIFKTTKNTLILIDEPELSMHLAWQMNFVKEVREILRVNHQQVILATHSGEIVDNNWDCVTDLYKLATKKIVQ